MLYLIKVIPETRRMHYIYFIISMFMYCKVVWNVCKYVKLASCICKICDIVTSYTKRNNCLEIA
jgi:hypothetical protein